MSALLLILLSAVLVNVAVLTLRPAWRPFEALPGTFDGARALAIATLITAPAIAMATWLLAKGVLEPSGLGYLRTLAYIVLILIAVPLMELTLRRDGRWRPQRPGFALLMTTNPALLGIALLSDERTQHALDALLFSIAAAGGFGFLLLAFAALHERLRHAAVPQVFREAPLALITAGIMALAFMGFTGVIQE